jgi:O-antigen/teichoic acid export membrane protein
MCIVLALAGLSSLIVKGVSGVKCTTELPEFILSVFIFVIFASIVLICGYFVLIYNMFGKSVALSLESVFFSISIVLHVFFLVNSAIYQGLGKFLPCLYFSLAFIIVTVIGIITISYFEVEGPYIALIVFLANFISVIFSFIHIRKNKWYREIFLINFKWLSLVTLGKKAAPVFLSTTLVLPVMFIATYSLSKVSTPIELSVYNVAFQWRNIISLIPSALSQAFLPHIIRSGKKSKGSWLNFSILYCGVIFITFIIAVIFIVNLDMFYNVYFLSYKNLFLIMAISSIAASLNSLFGQYFFVEGKYSICLLINVFWALTYISLFIFFNATLTAILAAKILLSSYIILLIFQIVLNRVYVFRKARCI